MIHPANNKVVALSVVAGAAMTQGQLLKFYVASGYGQMLAAPAIATGDYNSLNFGVFMAYNIPLDSMVVEFKGRPESTDFTLNADAGIGGGINSIASGTEIVALGGGGIAMVRLDKNALDGTPSTMPNAAVILQPKTTSSLLSTSGDISLNAGLVVQNDIATVVVLLGG
jgi:hypothetical protein